MLKRVQAIVSLVILLVAGPANSTLVFDGVEKPPGEAVGDASARMIWAIEWFYDALRLWEETTGENGFVQKEERIKKAASSFETAVGELKKSISEFDAILNSSDPTFVEALDERVAGPQIDDLVGRGLADILGSHGYTIPTTYRDVVTIAQEESNTLLGAFFEIGFSDNVEQFRASAFIVNQAVARAIEIGLAVGAYTNGLEE